MRDITHFSWRPFDIAETNVTASARLKYSLEEGTDPWSEPLEIFVLARSGQQVRQVVFLPINGVKAFREGCPRQEGLDGAYAKRRDAVSASGLCRCRDRLMHGKQLPTPIANR